MNLSQFTLLEKNVNDIRFGFIDLLINPNETTIFSKKIKCQNKKEAESCFEAALDRLVMNNDYVLRLLEVRADSELNEIEAIFDYPQSDLEDRRSFINPIEVLKILQDSLLALSYFESLQMLHGDIRPENIFYNESTRKYTIVDRLNNPLPPLEAQYNNLINQRTLYLSPEFFRHLVFQDSEQNFDYNPYKSEVFSLGLSVLSVMTDINHIQQLYDVENKRFRIEIFNEIKDNIRTIFFNEPQYNIIFEFLFDNILSLDFDQRDSPSNCLLSLGNLLQSSSKSANPLIYKELIVREQGQGELPALNANLKRIQSTRIFKNQFYQINALQFNSNRDLINNEIDIGQEIKNNSDFSKQSEINKTKIENLEIQNQNFKKSESKNILEKQQSLKYSTDLFQFQSNNEAVVDNQQVNLISNQNNQFGLNQATVFESNQQQQQYQNQINNIYKYEIGNQDEQDSRDNILVKSLETLDPVQLNIPDQLDTDILSNNEQELALKNKAEESQKNDDILKQQNNFQRSNKDNEIFIQNFEEIDHKNQKKEENLEFLDIKDQCATSLHDQSFKNQQELANEIGENYDSNFANKTRNLNNKMLHSVDSNKIKGNNKEFSFDMKIKESLNENQSSMDSQFTFNQGKEKKLFEEKENQKNFIYKEYLEIIPIDFPKNNQNYLNIQMPKDYPMYIITHTANIQNDVQQDQFEIIQQENQVNINSSQEHIKSIKLIQQNQLEEDKLGDQTNYQKNKAQTELKKDYQKLIHEEIKNIERNAKSKSTEKQIEIDIPNYEIEIPNDSKNDSKEPNFELKTQQIQYNDIAKNEFIKQTEEEVDGLKRQISVGTPTSTLNIDLVGFIHKEIESLDRIIELQTNDINLSGLIKEENKNNQIIESLITHYYSLKLIETLENLKGNEIDQKTKEEVQKDNDQKLRQKILKLYLDEIFEEIIQTFLNRFSQNSNQNINNQITKIQSEKKIANFIQNEPIQINENLLKEITNSFSNEVYEDLLNQQKISDNNIFMKNKIDQQNLIQQSKSQRDLPTDNIVKSLSTSFLDPIVNEFIENTRQQINFNSNQTNKSLELPIKQQQIKQILEQNVTDKNKHEQIQSIEVYELNQKLFNANRQNTINIISERIINPIIQIYLEDIEQKFLNEINQSETNKINSDENNQISESNEEYRQMNFQKQKSSKSLKDIEYQVFKKISERLIEPVIEQFLEYNEKIKSFKKIQSFKEIKAENSIKNIQTFLEQNNKENEIENIFNEQGINENSKQQTDLNIIQNQQLNQIEFTYKNNSDKNIFEEIPLKISNKNIGKLVQPEQNQGILDLTNYQNQTDEQKLKLALTKIQQNSENDSYKRINSFIKDQYLYNVEEEELENLTRAQLATKISEPIFKPILNQYLQNLEINVIENIKEHSLQIQNKMRNHDSLNYSKQFSEQNENLNKSSQKEKTDIFLDLQNNNENLLSIQNTQKNQNQDLLDDIDMEKEKENIKQILSNRILKPIVSNYLTELETQFHFKSDKDLNSNPNSNINKFEDIIEKIKTNDKNQNMNLQFQKNYFENDLLFNTQDSQQDIQLKETQSEIPIKQEQFEINQLPQQTLIEDNAIEQKEISEKPFINIKNNKFQENINQEQIDHLKVDFLENKFDDQNQFKGTEVENIMKLENQEKKFDNIQNLSLLSYSQRIIYPFISNYLDLLYFNQSSILANELNFKKKNSEKFFSFAQKQDHNRKENKNLIMEPELKIFENQVQLVSSLKSIGNNDRINILENIVPTVQTIIHQKSRYSDVVEVQVKGDNISSQKDLQFEIKFQNEYEHQISDSEKMINRETELYVNQTKQESEQKIASNKNNQTVEQQSVIDQINNFSEKIIKKLEDSQKFLLSDPIPIDSDIINDVKQFSEKIILKLSSKRILNVSTKKESDFNNEVNQFSEKIILKLSSSKKIINNLPEQEFNSLIQVKDESQKKIEKQYSSKKLDDISQQNQEEIIEKQYSSKQIVKIPFETPVKQEIEKQYSSKKLVDIPQQNQEEIIEKEYSSKQIVEIPFEKPVKQEIEKQYSRKKLVDIPQQNEQEQNEKWYSSKRIVEIPVKQEIVKRLSSKKIINVTDIELDLNQQIKTFSNKIIEKLQSSKKIIIIPLEEEELKNQINNLSNKKLSSQNIKNKRKENETEDTEFIDSKPIQYEHHFTFSKQDDRPNQYNNYETAQFPLNEQLVIQNNIAQETDKGLEIYDNQLNEDLLKLQELDIPEINALEINIPEINTEQQPDLKITGIKKQEEIENIQKMLTPINSDKFEIENKFKVEDSQRSKLLQSKNLQLIQQESPKKFQNEFSFGQSSIDQSINYQSIDKNKEKNQIKINESLLNSSDDFQSLRKINFLIKDNSNIQSEDLIQNINLQNRLPGEITLVNSLESLQNINKITEKEESIELNEDELQFESQQSFQSLDKPDSVHQIIVEEDRNDQISKKQTIIENINNELKQKKFEKVPEIIFQKKIENDQIIQISQLQSEIKLNPLKRDLNSQIIINHEQIENIKQQPSSQLNSDEEINLNQNSNPNTKLFLNESPNQIDSASKTFDLKFFSNKQNEVNKNKIEIKSIMSQDESFITEENYNSEPKTFFMKFDGQETPIKLNPIQSDFEPTPKTIRNKIEKNYNLDHSKTNSDPFTPNKFLIQQIPVEIKQEIIKQPLLPIKKNRDSQIFANSTILTPSNYEEKNTQKIFERKINYVKYSHLQSPIAKQADINLPQTLRESISKMQKQYENFGIYPKASMERTVSTFFQSELVNDKYHDNPYLRTRTIMVNGKPVNEQPKPRRNYSPHEFEFQKEGKRVFIKNAHPQQKIEKVSIQSQNIQRSNYIEDQYDSNKDQKISTKSDLIRNPFNDFEKKLVFNRFENNIPIYRYDKRLQINFND